MINSYFFKPKLVLDELRDSALEHELVFNRIIQVGVPLMITVVKLASGKFYYMISAFCLDQFKFFANKDSRALSYQKNNVILDSLEETIMEAHFVAGNITAEIWKHADPTEINRVCENAVVEMNEFLSDVDENAEKLGFDADYLIDSGGYKEDIYTYKAYSVNKKTEIITSNPEWGIF